MGLAGTLALPGFDPRALTRLEVLSNPWPVDSGMASRRLAAGMNGQMESPNSHERFRRFSLRISQIAGSPVGFILALIVVLAWACTGPLYRYSDTWQLVINTSTTIVTFLMVFLIQNTQNRDARAMHLKLDELIRAIKGARNKLVSLEEMTDEELDELQRQFQRVCGDRASKTNAAKQTTEPKQGEAAAAAQK
jgi:low affinity Fe/Cu permease